MSSKMQTGVDPAEPLRSLDLILGKLGRGMIRHILKDHSGYV